MPRSAWAVDYPPRFLQAYTQTLRRYWLCLRAELYLLGTDRLLVVLRVKRLRSL